MATPRNRSTKKDTQSAREEAEKRIHATDAVREITEELRLYPVRLLRQIVAEHRRRNAPAPDHVLEIVPYLGETALRALVEAGLTERVDDSAYSMRAYAPTSDGIALDARMDSE